ncbi:hypothetical protein OFR22_05455 [Brachyspira hyodysenteriae]|nr:hypothetical protein [Brachyspira hyodysenteriae]MCZ9994820.1 hypothetical protein [Brachyspira hyodysenteriae]
MKADDFIKFVQKRAEYLNSSRPTAVNLKLFINKND